MLNFMMIIIGDAAIQVITINFFIFKFNKIIIQIFLIIFKKLYLILNFNFVMAKN